MKLWCSARGSLFLTCFAPSVGRSGVVSLYRLRRQAAKEARMLAFMFLKVLPFYRNEVTRQAPIFFAGYSPDPWAEHVAEEPSFAKLGLYGLPILSSSISQPKLGLNWATKIFRQLAIGRENSASTGLQKFFGSEFGSQKKNWLQDSRYPKFGLNWATKNFSAAGGREIRP